MSERKLEPKDVPGTFLNLVSCLGLLPFEFSDALFFIPGPAQPWQY